MRFGIVVVLFITTALSDLVSGRQNPLSEQAVCLPPLTPGEGNLGAVRTVDPTAEDRLKELVRDSTLVREMLEYLATARVALIIRSRATLLRDHRAGGLSQFFVERGVLNGRLEFDRGARAANSQRITLAHEIGHAVELAALPRRSTAALGNQLLSQIGQHDPWSSRLVIETPFARGVDARVSAELHYGPDAPGTLDGLAKRHRITLAPCAADRRHAEAGTERGRREKKD